MEPNWVDRWFWNHAAIWILVITFIGAGLLGLWLQGKKQERVQEGVACLERGGTIVYSYGSYSACVEKK